MRRTPPVGRSRPRRPRLGVAREPLAREPLARRALWLALLCGVAASPHAPAAFARGTPKETHPPEWTEEDGRIVLRVFEPSPLKAYAEAPTDLPAGAKADLVVILHGHGGTATGVLGYASRALSGTPRVLLACEGSGEIQTPQGGGHTWDAKDAKAVLACTKAALAKFPIDPKRVVLMGHSAGGSMSLATFPLEPAAFAGVYTTASPATPSSAHKGARLVVNLGTLDGNFAGFAAARAAVEKSVVGRIVAVTGLGHDLPDGTYSREAIAWILDAKAPSEVLTVPAMPSDAVVAPADSKAAKAKGGAFRHVLLFQAGGRGAPEGAPARAAAKAAAQRLADELERTPEGTDAADLVATRSEDPLSKETRGEITGAVLARYGGPLVAAMAKLAGGDVSKPVESDAGWHVVFRDR